MYTYVVYIKSFVSDKDNGRNRIIALPQRQLHFAPAAAAEQVARLCTAVDSICQWF